MNKELSEIIRVMSQTHGREISMYDESFLVKSVEKRRLESGADTLASYQCFLEKNNLESDSLFNSLNITYSDFFRNPLTFALLEQWVLPALISSKSGAEIRVWSAGCSSGQEAYSVAMLLSNMNTLDGEPVRFRILATDISQSALEAAREGVYSKDAVRNLRLRDLENYFKREGDTYTIVSRLKKSIEFYSYDLLDRHSNYPPESIYGNFDIVLCSNLLFYYKPDIQHFILQKVQQALSPEGYLVTGEAERAFVEQTGNLKRVVPPAAVFQIKKM